MAKILVVANINVPPIMAGSQRCIYNYCETLKELGHEVFFLYSGYADRVVKEIVDAFWQGKYFHYQYSTLLRAANLIKRKVVSKLKKGGYNIGYYYPVYGLDRYVESLNAVHHFDAVIVNYPWMTPLLLRTSISTKLIFTHDKFTGKRDIINADYYTLTEVQEREALDRADIVLSIQEEETKYFKELLPEKKILTVYTRFEYKSCVSETNNNVLFFSGNSDLNRNGINYFVDKVWPLVKVKVPTVKLVIGGGICKSLGALNGHEDIELAGYVDDVEKFYRKGNIAINPVYQGTGLKIKTLESISYGKITIVHPHSISGLYKNSSAPVYIGSDDITYANHLIDALTGNIDIKGNLEKCSKYITEMNQYIIEQYRLIKFKE